MEFKIPESASPVPEVDEESIFTLMSPFRLYPASQYRFIGRDRFVELAREAVKVSNVKQGHVTTLYEDKLLIRFHF